MFYMPANTDLEVKSDFDDQRAENGQSRRIFSKLTIQIMIATKKNRSVALVWQQTKLSRGAPEGREGTGRGEKKTMKKEQKEWREKGKELIVAGGATMAGPIVPNKEENPPKKEFRTSYKRHRGTVPTFTIPFPVYILGDTVFCSS
ncbi:uncharacterized protein FOMMEDRAFT_156194 [Fomitiporia mediterranea MF3/22]|uniref:uncharacterized protein n=1 Tax=Fomitiporia mediterranea (strain MF3/22) TaxID=694068 RepID=UPI00044097D2|nr:uncharacterized protein FOMMEDRAFT_156194 [Fomitiporia mediterranea MF3/22]EJD02837.1 hypothetical protein FOMMEDRAFT_156194 [Fomitiporia mediterranea MF3/22]